MRLRARASLPGSRLQHPTEGEPGCEHCEASPISSCSDDEKNERRPLRHLSLLHDAATVARHNAAVARLDHDAAGGVGDFDSPAKLVPLQSETASTDCVLDDCGAGIVGVGPSSKNVLAAFKYPLLSLKLHGLTWKSNENARCDWCTGYCILVSMMFFVFGVLQIVKFDGDITLGPVFMFHIAVVLSWVQSFIGHASFVFGTRRHLRKLLDMWENYRQYHGGIPYKQLYKVASALTMGFNAYLLLLFGTGILVCTFVRPDLASYMVKPFLNYGGRETSLVLWGIGSTITFFLLWVWLEPYIFVATLVHLLKREFVQASKDLSKSVANVDGAGSSPGGGGAAHAHTHIDIEDHRKRHLMLCKITNKMDDMIYGFLIFTYAIDVPVLCAMIFVMFHAENYPNLDWASLSFGLLWFCYVSCHLAALTLNGAFLTSAVSTHQHTH